MRRPGLAADTLSILHKNHFNFSLSVTIVLLLVSRAGSEEVELTFEHDILPILKIHCFDCHGAKDKPEGDLDLRLQDSWSEVARAGRQLNPKIRKRACCCDESSTIPSSFRAANSADSLRLSATKGRSATITPTALPCGWLAVA